MCISFTINYEKTLEAIVWFANKKPSMKFHWILKMLYLSDRTHLNQYGKPILGDDYIAMQYGPVGSVAYDILKGDCPYIDEQEKLNIQNKSVSTKQSCDLSYFSKYDIITFEKVLDTYGDCDFDQLCEITHSFRDWENSRECKTSNNPSIDYKDMIDQDTEDRNCIIEELENFSKSFIL